jgi:hypothetical protein
MTAAPVKSPTCDRCRGGREWYTYLWGLYEFDVDRARQLTSDGREPVELEEASARQSLADCKMDEEHIDHVDASLPGIIAHVWYTTIDGEVFQGHVHIDGHHRAARCLRDGLPVLAYLLTEEESRAILLKKPDEPGAWVRGRRLRPRQYDSPPSP